MTTYTGQNLGAKKIHRIAEGIKSVIKLSAIISIAISAAMILFGRGLLGLFISPAEADAGAVVDIAYRYLVIMSLFLLSLYLLHAYRSALQGLGNTISPMVSGIIEFAMRVTAALALPALMGQTGIFYAEVAAWVGAAIYLISSYYREIKKLRKKMRLEEDAKKCAPEDMCSSALSEGS
jgi:Na+-driven multidrug efflux pump